MISINDSPTLCYCSSLRKSTRIITKIYDQLLATSGLKVTQYALMVNLNRLEPATINQLADVMILERTTLVRNLNILIKQGLVEMVIKHTSKAHIIQLTAMGKIKVEETKPLWQSAQEKVAKILSDEEQSFIHLLLTKLQKSELLIDV